MSEVRSDDYKDPEVPIETQGKIAEFIKKTLFPAILDHTKHQYPVLFGFPITQFSFGCFFEHLDSMEDLFTRKQLIDLYTMEIVDWLPNTGFRIKNLEAVIGAARRLSRDIDRKDYEDLLKKIVPYHFRLKYAMSNFGISQINSIFFTAVPWRRRVKMMYTIWPLRRIWIQFILPKGRGTIFGTIQTFRRGCIKFVCL